VAQQEGRLAGRGNFGAPPKPPNSGSYSRLKRTAALSSSPGEETDRRLPARTKAFQLAMKSLAVSSIWRGAFPTSLAICRRTCMKLAWPYLSSGGK
jgi:hypothetical protein